MLLNIISKHFQVVNIFFDFFDIKFERTFFEKISHSTQKININVVQNEIYGSKDMKTSFKNAVYFIMFTVLFALIAFVMIYSIGIADNKEKRVNSEGKITVVIDAGHGGEDGGAIGVNGVYEKDINLSVALKIGDFLEAQGIEVIYTRTEDVLLYDRTVDYHNRKKSLDLAARVDLANKTKNCVFVSVHMNSFSQSKYRGSQIYYSKNNPQSFVLASSIQNSIKSNLQPQNTRKATEATSRIYVLDRLDCPAVLIECGFISNGEECRLLCTEVYQDQLSQTISEEIKNYVEKIQKPY